MNCGMQTRLVRVLLSEDFRASCFGYDPTVPMREAIVLTIDGTDDDKAACEIAYAVCNSNPDEMFCPEQYHEAVVAYRYARNRSLSVGDACIIGETTYSVEHCGFKAATTPANIIG